MPIHVLTASAASKAKAKQTVSTQSKLDKALKNKKLRTLTIRTEKRTGLTLNKNAFQTWSEHAKGNTITVNSKRALVTVSRTAAVDDLNINRKGSSVTLDVNGQAKKVNVNTKTKITINGVPSKNVLFKLGKKSVGATIANNTSSTIKVKIIGELMRLMLVCR